MAVPYNVSLSSSTLGKVWRRIVGNTCQEADPLRSQVGDDGEFLSFGIYAARRLLNTTAVSQEQAEESEAFEAIRTLGCMYLRADVPGFTDCIAAFELNSFLATKVLEYDIFRSESIFTGVRRQSSLNLVVDFIHLLEALMMEYLSYGWDSVDKLFAANEDDLQDDGMTCVWKPKGKEITVATNGAPAENRARANWKRAYKVAIKQVTMNALGTQRKFKTFAQMALELQREPSSNSEQTECERHKFREGGPILLLLGGGMAAGKSTVREIIGSDQFWSNVCKDAVIVEADAIKNQDVVFKVLSGRLGNDPSVSSLVHEYSTAAAENMLAAAVNSQKDIVFDGTMTWLPFVEQTIAMVRDYHHRYVRGPGYHLDENGERKEEYWKQECKYSKEELASRVPYRIEVVGVTCDPALAVARGIWRKLRTGRGVPISSQLRSHRLFSGNFESIAKLVDSATLYHTGTCLTTMTSTIAEAPKVIAHSSQVTRGEMLVNPPMWSEFQKIKDLNDDATSRDALYQSTKKKNINFQQITKAFSEMKSRARSMGTLQDSQQKS